MSKKRNALCYRCEHRARHLESMDKGDHMTGSGPRCECRASESAVYSCYMFLPTAPMIVAPNEGEERPLFAGAMLSGRMHPVRIPPLKGKAEEYEDGTMVYMVPGDEEKKDDITDEIAENCDLDNPPDPMTGV